MIKPSRNHPRQSTHDRGILVRKHHALIHNIFCLFYIELMNTLFHGNKIASGKQILQHIFVIGIQKFEDVFFGDDTDELAFAVHNRHRVNTMDKYGLPELPKGCIRLDQRNFSGHYTTDYHTEIICLDEVYGSEKRLSTNETRGARFVASGDDGLLSSQGSNVVPSPERRPVLRLLRYLQ